MDVDKQVKQIEEALSALRDALVTGEPYTPELGMKQTLARSALGALVEALKSERLSSQGFVDSTVYYRNLAIELGAKPTQMRSPFDRDLAEKWELYRDDPEGWTASDEVGEVADLWVENSRLEAQVDYLGFLLYGGEES